MWNAIKDAPHKYVVDPLVEAFVNKIGSLGHGLWDSFIQIIPDLAGYGMMASGVGVMLSSMTGRGMLKPLGYLAGGLILAVCLLEVQ